MEGRAPPTQPGVDGLRAAEAARRLAVEGPNELPRPAEPSLARRLAGQLLDPLALVLAAAAGASVLVLGHTAEGVAIAAIVVLNIAIATSQEQRAAGAVAALERLTAPVARVRRDGASLVVPARDVVRDDVVELAAGDRVPADVVLLEASSLAVDEALLTGESLPADKVVGGGSDASALPADRHGDAFAGTLVVRGRGVGRVTRTGARTQVGAIASTLESVTTPPLVAELRRVAARMSALAIGLGTLLVPILWARGDEGEGRLAGAVLGGVALAVAAIPEGLPTIVTSSLALGARRMAERGAIVRQLAAIEALGAADVICTDKTGTLTTGRLTVAGATPARGLAPELWLACTRCNDAAGDVGDPVDVALLVAARDAGVAGPIGRRTAEQPFDAGRRTMATVHEVDGQPVLSLKGAPESVLPRCRAGVTRRSLEAASLDMARDGLRVLAVAGAPVDDLEAVDLDPLGLVAFHDPLRPSAVEAVARCRAAGIRVVLVTGDHLGTAVATATAAGIPGTSR
jgi:magnesium-transporting ATPase (P-type)